MKKTNTKPRVKTLPKAKPGAKTDTDKTLEDLLVAWDLGPYILREVFKRARAGNRTAKSIIATAEATRKADAFRRAIKRMTGG